MDYRENCVYCGKTITKRSREHIIQNAIGGLFESEDICCPDCNNYVSKYIDAPFTKIFNPIISLIENFTKTNNKKSKPSYTGKAIHNGKLYDVLMKAGKVVSCPELSKELKCDVSKLEWEIVAYDFLIENKPFKNGLSKIAFNFALERRIPADVLKNGVNIKIVDDKMVDLSFLYPIIPFVPLNPMDRHIELNTDIELYHNLILFSQGKMLWCYIDLFNTFQYYVLLSGSLDENTFVHETYLQLLQKLDRSMPTLYIRKPKHILIYAMFYNIEPCMDLDEFKKRIESAIKKEPLQKEMADIISVKMESNYLTPEILTQSDIDKRDFYLKSLLLYSDENGLLNESNFRKVTLTGNDFEIVSYPLFINTLIRNRKIHIQPYTFDKFDRLNKFLAGFDKIENSME